jgi:hypothetical protein
MKLAARLGRHDPQDPLVRELRADVLEICQAHKKARGCASANEVRQWPAVKRVLDRPCEQQPRVVLTLASMHDQVGGYLGWTVHEMMSMLLRRKAPWRDDELVELLDALLARAYRPRSGPAAISAAQLAGQLTAVANFLDEHEPSPALVQRLTALRAALVACNSARERRAILRISTMLGEVDDDDPLGAMANPWSDAIRQHVRGGDATEQSAFDKLLRLARDGRATKPSVSFDESARALCDEFGADTVARLAGELLSTAARVPTDRERGVLPPELGDALRGVAWTAAVTGSAEAVRGLGDMGLAGWKKVPSYGPMSRKAADACIAALARIPDGAGQLGRLRSLVKQPVAQVSKAIDASAELLGIDRDAFEELVAPTFDLDADGTRRHTLGDYTAEVFFDEHVEPRLRFQSSDGKALKSVPAAVRSDHKSELTALRADVKDIAAMRRAQRARIERLLLSERAWRFEQWEQRYLRHGLVGVLARRLIWTIDGTAVLALDEHFITSDGQKFPDPAADATVGLWHPVDADTEEVRAWRVLLEDRQLRQPFKQAHREIYLLTDAERATRVYSNRFAAHILKQYQMASLARERGWQYALQGAWDTADEQVHLRLPEHDLDACFHVDRPSDWGDIHELISAEGGVFLYVLTDQVRFHRHDRELALHDIPQRVFSEVMRDVDLFVGVSSVGNDPTWTDHGIGRRFTDYWQDYSFGELGAQGHGRYDILARLLPKLTIADRCELDGRFLRVRGDIRTYKIHLGSTNILMEPDDCYLCIVTTGRSDADSIFLPFEGDTGIAIILSKAFLLANDTAIDDHTITSQINPR